jgi:hypothetical protein
LCLQFLVLMLIHFKIIPLYLHILLLLKQPLLLIFPELILKTRAYIILNFRIGNFKFPACLLNLLFLACFLFNWWRNHFIWKILNQLHFIIEQAITKAFCMVWLLALNSNSSFSCILLIHFWSKFVKLWSFITIPLFIHLFFYIIIIFLYFIL